MLALNLVYDALFGSEQLTQKLEDVRGTADPLGGIYIGTPDFDNTTDADIVALSPWIRITDLPGDETTDADDDRFLEYPRVQIDFWCKNELLQQTSEIDTLIRKAMHGAGWERVYHRSDADHDTPQLRMVTAYFQSQGIPV
ncbi:phage tail protein [Lacticaseibacillus songhuajiangensis]|uniref:phage tail protein n=1 Tax=Lacticaseibacillus songhuajiangensis TaxID=1296539 RepID=UPI001CDD7291|nr:phage tail protein [Lacticaseibacillus songhuajiangensis]